MYCTVYMTSLLGSRDRPGNTAELVILYKSVYVLYMTNLLGSRDRPGNTAELVILYMYCTVLYCPGGYLCEMETRLDNALVQGL